MKRFCFIIATALLLAACGPGVDPEEPGQPDTPELPSDLPDEPDPDPVLQFASIWEDLFKGETTSAACKVSGAAPGKSYAIRYSSSNSSVADVSREGKVTAKAPGKATITATLDGTDVSVSRDYFVTDLSQLGQAYSRDRAFVTGHTIYYKAVMQSWDFFDNYFYVCQVCGSPHTLSFTRKPLLQQSPQAYMHLKYYGHGDNIFVERASDGDYLWTPNYGTLEEGATNRYADSQVLSRIKFAEGMTFLPENSNFNCVIPGMKRMAASYDADNGNVGIWCRDSGGKAWFYVFSMQDIKAAKPESVKLSFSRTYGSPAVTDTPTIQARDLSKLTPVFKFRMPFNYVPQGYDYHHNKIYFMRGDGAEEEERVAGTNKNWARVYYISPQTGKTLVEKDLPWVDDIALLKSEGITDLGYLEPEGIKLKDGIIYLGFASKDSGKSPERRINIFKYQQ